MRKQQIGKTVPSSGIALEWEIDTWKAFRNTHLRGGCGGV